MTVGKKIPSSSSLSHVTGKSIFIDDRPLVAGEVFVSFLGSPVAAGRLVELDPSGALREPGVVGVFTYRDFVDNKWGTISADQPLLVAEQIGYQHEPLCLIAGTDRVAVEEAKKKIQVKIEESLPVLTIEEAISKKDFLFQAQPLSQGDPEGPLKRSPHRISGILDVGGQEHFYLESQAAIAYPLEEGQLEIHSSSQHPSEVQHVCAKALGLRYNQVVCIVKRMGGAFGGKESQAAPFAAYAALVAQKLQRPARMVLSKDDDMRVTGKRHPFKIFYEAGFNDDGKINAVKFCFYADGGAYTDLSPSVLKRALFHADGAYFIENFLVEGFVCKTNKHSNTAFRGFGAPQGNLAIENLIEEVALFLKKDSFEIRKINCYQGNHQNKTPFGQLVEHNSIPQLFEQLHRTANYKLRYQEVIEFNHTQKGKLRGIAMSGLKFGIAFNTRHLNQASAQVNIQSDGSVQVSTGATEMGQGVYTKIGQVVASALGIDIKLVQVMATSTEKNHNTSPTAASSGTDLNGAAALDACHQIINRLKWVAHCYFNKLSLHGEFPPLDPHFDFSSVKWSNGSAVSSLSPESLEWKKVIELAYLNRVSLGAHGFFRTPELTFDPKTAKGRAFNYFTTGAAVSEVEIDRYTGACALRQVDILMDLGRLINEGIDRGQIAGAFIQGVGWLTTERLAYDSKGALLTHSPTTYKIPAIGDLPAHFKIDFLDSKENERNIYHSKAVGEPPLLLSASVWLAIKQAIGFGGKAPSRLRVPATGEEILMRLDP